MANSPAKIAYGVYSVTKLKKNAYYKVAEQRKTEHLDNIYSDQNIELKGFYSNQKFPDKLRRIRSKDPETGKIIMLLTNNFSWSAKTIAQIYKERLSRKELFLGLVEYIIS